MTTQKMMKTIWTGRIIKLLKLLDVATMKLASRSGRSGPALLLVFETDKCPKIEFNVAMLI